MAKHTTSLIALLTRIGLLSSLLLASGCSREVPSTWTSDSPASADAQAAPVTDVTLSLDGDPPLPGEPATGWLGLEQTAPATEHSGHAGHMGHGGHGGQAEQPSAPASSEPASEPSKPVTKTKPAPQPKPVPQPEPAPQPEPEPDEHAGHEEGAHHHGH